MGDEVVANSLDQIRRGRSVEVLGLGENGAEGIDADDLSPRRQAPEQAGGENERQTRRTAS